MDRVSMENLLEEDERYQENQIREHKPLIRNPRIVGPDDFYYWLLMEQQEQF